MTKYCQAASVCIIYRWNDINHPSALPSGQHADENEKTPPKYLQLTRKRAAEPQTHPCHTLSVGAQCWRPDAAHEQDCEETISSGWKCFSLFKRTHTWLDSWGPNIATAQQKASTPTNCYRPEVQQYYSACWYELCFAFLSCPRKYTVLCRVWSFVFGLSFTSKGIVWIISQLYWHTGLQRAVVIWWDDVQNL